MEKQIILNIIRDSLYNYKTLLYEHDYSVFVETVAEEASKSIKENEDENSN